MKRIVILGLLILLHMIWTKLNAQPDFPSAHSAHGIVLFPDLTQRNVYYYLPGDLAIARNSDSRPDFNFIMMRYNGSAVYGENEEMRYRNILTMRIVMNNISSDSLRLAKASLGYRSSGIQLKPIPISKLDAMVVFIPVGGNDSTAVVGKGNLSAEEASGYTTSSTYWRERFFTLYLDNHSANLLLEAFRKDYTAISFMYAFHAKGTSSKRIPDFSGYGKMAPVFQRQLNEVIKDTTDSVKDCIVKSNAFPIYLDTLKYPDLIRQIDINNGVPPGYAVLNIRNYDFANNLRNDLYEKAVELEASGAGGGKVYSTVSFRSTAPDITSTMMKFRYAVKLDQPYRYRVRELLTDGREIVSDWKEVTMWSALLDVTTRKN
jgi:hypothetical protein